MELVILVMAVLLSLLTAVVSAEALLSLVLHLMVWMRR